MPDDWQSGGFGLYIHWPFCEAKCPYCDFNSHVSRTIDHDAWLKAYLEELDRFSDLTGGRILQSVFFGGGTPSLMRPDVVHRILDRIQDRWRLANDLEVTLEANPSSVEATKFESLAHAGVNRVSLGVQALSDIDLRRLGRLHSVADALAAIQTALTHFDRVSFDLIYARQDQTMEDWRAELSYALSIGMQHLSLYQLTIETGTAFGDLYATGKLKGLPNEDLGADLYELTVEMCTHHGLANYEVSNFAKPGEESRHNLTYWRYGDYVGIGPGAHGRVTLDGVKYATEQVRAPNEWLNGCKDAEWRALSRYDAAEESLLMGLRLSEGFPIARFSDLSGKPICTDRIAELVVEGFLTFDGERICTTQSGRLLLNAVIVRLLA